MNHIIISIPNFILCLGCVTFLSMACNSNNKAEKEITFKVYGNCEMCETTIEGALNKQEGISSAEWNKDTKMMKVAYDTTVTNVKEMHLKIADAGYDTELARGNDKAYKELHQCCQYKRKD